MCGYCEADQPGFILVAAVKYCHERRGSVSNKTWIPPGFGYWIYFTWVTTTTDYNHLKQFLGQHSDYLFQQLLLNAG
jgi:hypothetical protein